MNSERLSQRLADFAEELPLTARSDLYALLFRGLPPIDQLATLPEECFLSPEESHIFANAQLSVPKGTSASLGKSNLVVILKATRRCNLRCTYCRAWRDDSHPDMSFDTLAHVMAHVLSAPDLQTVEFVWHGGEVTLLDSSYFLKALYIQSLLNRHGVRISNSVQTNGVRMNLSILEIFQRFEFSVGVSVDAPQILHEKLRLNVAGKSTWAQVQAGITRMKAMEIPLSLLSVVGPETVQLGERALLESLCDLGVLEVGLLNMVPENGLECQAKAGTFLPWDDYLCFLKKVYTLWRQEYKTRLIFRELSDLERLAEGKAGTMCYFEKNCMGGFLTIEHDGRVAACDKYVGETEYSFGSLKESSLATLLRSAPNLSDKYAEVATSKAAMADCPWHHACRGGCPHDRRLTQRLATDQKGCCGYASLLDHIAEISNDPSFSTSIQKG